MAVKISELANLNSPAANTIVFALDSQLNPNTSYQLKLSTIRSFVTSSSYIHANSAFDKANSANVHANSAYTLANSANIVAFSAFANSNSVYIFASAAFANGNSTFVYANSSYAVANLAYIQANSAYIHANSANVHANAAYSHSNSGFIQANSAYSKANSANVLAETANTSANFAVSYASSANINSILALTNSTEAKDEALNSKTIAENAFNKANVSFDLISNNIIYTTSAYDKANSVEISLSEYSLYSPLINVKVFGAVGDGVSDDTFPIQTAIDSSVGKILFIPAGNYVCNNLILYSKTTIIGTGNDSVFLANSSNISLFSLYDSEGINSADINLSKIRISNGGKENCNGVIISGNSSSNLCSGINITGVNIYSNSNSFNSGILLSNCRSSIVDNNIFNGCNTDIELKNSKKIKVINNSFESNVSNNFIETSNSDYNIIYGNISYSNIRKIGANTVSVNNIENVKI